MTYGRPIQVERIVSRIGDRAQTNTQHYGKRPYGVGLLVSGVDEAGPHLFEFQPSGITHEMSACAIGARSQMARTYLERHLDEFPDCARENLIDHALRALKESLPQDKELTIDNTTVGVAGVASEVTHGKMDTFKVYDGQEVTAFLESANDATRTVTTESQPSQAMDVDS